jgi:hypothetical protein
MSPEQAVGDKVTAGTDLFALGVVLYEMAARRTMFKGRSEAEIRRLLNEDHGARLAATLDTHYAPLIKVLVRALQRDPAARFATAADMAKELSDLLPAPVQARDETVQFWRQISELEQTEVAASSTIKASSVDRAGEGSGSSRATMAGFVAATSNSSLVAAGIAVASLVFLVFTLWRLLIVDEPVVAARSAPRSAPVVEQAPEPQPAEVEDRVIVAGAALPGVEGEPDPEERPVVVQAGAEGLADAEAAEITLLSLQPAEVYLDGKLVREVGASLRVVPGRHLVAFVSEDGRTATHTVEVAAGARRRFTWDFATGKFR